CYDRDKIGLAQPALSRASRQISFRSLVQHRKMRCLHGKLAREKTRFENRAKILRICLEGCLREFENRVLRTYEAVLEHLRLFSQIFIDAAKSWALLVHEINAILDKAEGHAALQKNETRSDPRQVVVHRIGKQQFIRDECLSELDGERT